MRQTLTKGIMSWFLGLLERHLNIVIVILIAMSFLFIIGPLELLSTRLVENIAVSDAKLYAEAVAQFRTIYSSEIVKKAQDFGMKISHDVHEDPQAIPLPATLSILLGKRIGESAHGGVTKLVSPYPFPFREGTGGLRDSFEVEAWNYLQKTPMGSYHRFEMIDEKMVLRYATADVMASSCVECHNQHPLSPKRDWKVGDVRGILEVIRPVDVVLAQAKSEIFGTQLFITVLTLLFVVLLVIAVRHLKELKNELVKTAKTALAGSAAKTEFLANMSHEIRTPMNSIVGMAELLSETRLDETQEGYLKGLQTASDSLLDLVNDVLDVSKIEAGCLELENVNFNLSEVLDSIIEIMGPKAFQKKIEFIVACDPKVNPNLVGDPTRLRQILINLVGNAIKFTMHGEVVLKVELTGGNSSKVHLCFSVLDTGVGISFDAIQKIFQKFTQAESSTTRKFGGTGLGLNISQMLVKMMGGQIKVTSEEGKGSRFYFELVLPTQNVRASTSVHQKQFRKKCILIIEDNESARKMVHAELTARGADVVEAEDGLSGIKLAQRAALNNKSFDLVLTDHQLPDLDSAEIVERIHDVSGEKKPTIVIMGSINVKIEFLAQCSKAKSDGFLPKPIKAAQLLEVVTQLLMPDQVEFAASLESAENALLVFDPGTQVDFNLKEIVDLCAERSVLVQSFDELMDPKLPISTCAMVVNVANMDCEFCKWFLRIRENGWSVPILFVFPDGQEIQRLAIGWESEIQFVNEEITYEIFYRHLRKVVLKGLSCLNDRKVVSQSSPSRLLIVDDCEDNRNMLQIFLKNLDCKIEFACDGIEALQKYHESRFDLILMDLQLPKKSGYEVVTTIRAFEKEGGLARTPIVALSGFAMKEEVQRALDVGCDVHLSKPIKKQQLLEVITQYTSQPIEVSKDADASGKMAS